MSKEINRRGFLALGAGAVAATAVGATVSQAEGKKELGFYDVVTILNSKVAELMEKSKGRFCPKYNTPGYIVVPKSQEGLLDLKNQYGISVRDYCKGVWPCLEFISLDKDGQLYIELLKGQRTHDAKIGDRSYWITPPFKGKWMLVDRMGYRLAYDSNVVFDLETWRDKSPHLELV